MKKKLVILDADMFVFLAGWPYHDQLTKLGSMAAKKQLDNLIDGVIKRTSPDLYLGFIGKHKSKCFRYKVGTIKPYKGQRPSPPWQEYFKPILKKHMIDKWGFYPMEHLEADDAVVIAHNQFKDEYDITHVGEDKDFKQAGKYKRYNPKKKDFEYMTHFEGRKFFWCQMLHGDSSDNIGGVKGVGAKNKFVQEIQSMDKPTEERLFDFVRDIYLDKYGEEAQEVMIENYLLLHMCTTPRFDYPEDVVLTKCKEDQMYTTAEDIIDL